MHFLFTAHSLIPWSIITQGWTAILIFIEGCEGNYTSNRRKLNYLIFLKLSFWEYPMTHCRRWASLELVYLQGTIMIQNRIWIFTLCTKPSQLGFSDPPDCTAPLNQVGSQLSPTCARRAERQNCGSSFRSLHFVSFLSQNIKNSSTKKAVNKQGLLILKLESHPPGKGTHLLKHIVRIPENRRILEDPVVPH